MLRQTKSNNTLFLLNDSLLNSFFSELYNDYHLKLSSTSMLYTRLFEGSCVSERRILISIGGLYLWSVDILHQS